MMNMILHRRRLALLEALAVLSALFIRLPSTAWAAFDNDGTGARPTALGDTYVAAADDSLSLMYNPAGLAQLHQSELTSEYSRIYAGLSDNSTLSQSYLGYSQPIAYGGTVSVGWKEFKLDDLYQERTLSLGYGEWITDKVAAGFALKQLYHAFGVPNMVVDNSGNIQSGTPDFFAQNGNSKSVYSGDIGTVVKYNERHTFGFSVMDINEPNLALSGSDHDTLPKTVRLGWDYKPRDGLSLLGSMTERKALANQSDVTWTGAFEKAWASKDSGNFAVRGSLAAGSRDFQQAAFGAGYGVDSFKIDYAFQFPLAGITVGETAGTHRFSLAWRFGSVSHTSLDRKRKAKKSAGEPATPKVDKDGLSDLMAEMEEPLAPERQAPASKTKKNPAAVVVTISSQGVVTVSSPTVAAVAPSTTAAVGASAAAAVAASTGAVVAPTETVSTATPAAVAKSTASASIPAKKPAAKARSHRKSTKTADLPWAYHVQPGDTLIGLADKYYGNSERWHDIYELNSDRLGRAGDLTVGQVLFMPARTRRQDDGSTH